MIILYTYMNLPLTVWLLRGFFADIPVEIEEAAYVDGASRLRTFFGVTLPLALPGVISTALLAFIFAWNEFLFANVLTGASTRTAPVSLTEYVNPVSVEWNNIMAAGTLVVLPVWIFALSCPTLPGARHDDGSSEMSNVARSANAPATRAPHAASGARGTGVEFEQVVVTFPDGTTALKGLDLKVGDGEFVVLVGPSGCGKSTALRALAGLQPVSAGTIRIRDRDVTDLDPQARDIAMVFQNYALYPHKSVYENLAYPLRVRGDARRRYRPTGAPNRGAAGADALSPAQAARAVRRSEAARRDGARARAQADRLPDG